MVDRWLPLPQMAFRSQYEAIGLQWTCRGRSARQISASEEWRSALVITAESMWSAPPTCIGCMGKLQTPNGPLTHPDIPIISLLRHRFFTLPLLVGVWPTVGDFFFSYLRLYYEDCCCHDEVSANVKPAFLVPTQMDGASRDPCQRQKAGNKDKRKPFHGGTRYIFYQIRFFIKDRIQRKPYK